MIKAITYKKEKIVLNAISYFDVFNYPLKASEIVNYLSEEMSLTTMETCLDKMVNHNILQLHNGFYGICNIEQNVEKRIRSNKTANRVLPNALKMGKKINTFPFIKAVFISGSLSKNVMHEDSDYDFFIISADNRIWLSKLFLKLYKFFFLRNNKIHFCVNYIIAEDGLEIPDKNLFTAIEIATLIPITNGKIATKFYEKNEWWKNYLPNFKVNTQFKSEITNKSSAVKSVEKICGGFIGNFLDSMILKFNKIRNRKVYKDLLQNKDYDLMLRTEKNASKSHASNHQNRILNLQNQKLEKLEKALHESIINQ